MRRRGASSIAANPVLIGAATTLVVIVAVFLAYNANNGLPFVPTYQLTADVPNAANLVRGNDVRMGGARVGVVDTITPQAHKDGTVTAQLKLKLQTSIKPLPKNSTVLIRPRSALGLKYVEITKGNLPVNGSENAQRNGFADGATIPLKNATPSPVEIDEVFNTFDKPTRVASQTNLTEFGNALAGRGQDLNDAIQFAPVLLASLIPVAQNLSESGHAPEQPVPGARARGFDHRAGRRRPGRPLRQPRHDLLGAGRRGPAVHPGLDLQRPAGARARRSACSRSSACSWPTPRSWCATWARVSRR